MQNRHVSTALVVIVMFAVLTAAASAASGALELLRPWGGANQDPAGVNRVVVTYSLSASNSVPVSAVAAVEAAIASWDAAIDGRESGWDFDLVEAGVAREADIKIQLKKNGSPFVAGVAKPRLDRDGFVKQVSVSISGGFASIPSPEAEVEQIALHELGHALGLGHHSNEEDLMGRTLGYEGGGPSACDLDGFVAVHAWLTDADPATGPGLPAATSVSCS